MRLENYALVRMKDRGEGALGLTTECDNKNVTDDSGYYVAALGEVYGREGFEDGSCIYTSAIDESKDGFIRTCSGSKYELGQKDPDYVKFLDAERKRIPILDDWSVVVTNDEGVCIKGVIRDTSESFQKKVISQDGPFLTFADGYQIFVDWISIGKDQLSHVAFAANMGLIRVHPFCQIGLEPIILKEDWEFIRDLDRFLNA